MIRLYSILSGVLLILSSIYAGEVYVIGTADLHGNIRNLAKLAPVFRRYPQAVKVDAGDLMQGNFAVRELHGKPMIEALNYLDFDVWVPGNHEFEFESRDFRQWSKDFHGVILGAQWRFGGYKPAGHTVIKRGRYRIGIIGLGESKIAKKLRFYPDLVWQNEMSALREAVNALTAEKCHAVILVCHIGAMGNYGEVHRFLQTFPEIDAVICAHSHREHFGDIVSGRLVTQAGPHGKSAVLLTLKFDADDTLEYVNSQLVYPDERSDAGIINIAAEAERSVRAQSEKYYGECADAGRFGAVAAEAVRIVTGADAAVVSFNEKYFCRRITGSVLFELFPFGNRLVMVEMDLTRLRRWVSRYDKPPRRCALSVAPGISKGTVKVVMSDFLCSQIRGLKEAKVGVLPFFERETIAGQLEKLLSGTIL